MSDDNALIAAEAAVTSKRPGHVSLFEADLPTFPTSVKQFYADPALLKEAVQRLKQAGFTVPSVGKFGMSLVGPKKLYEEIFGVRLIARTAADGGQPKFDSAYRVVDPADPANTWLIKPQTAEYKALLDGVALSQPSQYRVSNPDADVSVPPKKPEGKDWLLYLEEIPPKLNKPPHLVIDPSKNNMHIAVIDSGFDAEHPYFKRHFNADRLVIDDDIELYLRIENRKIREWHREWMEGGQKYDRIHRLIGSMKVLTDSEGKELTELIRDRSEWDFDKVDRYLWDFDQATKSLSSDTFEDGHGTTVMANLLAVAPELPVTVIKTGYPDTPGGNPVAFLVQALRIASKLDPKPKIISMSTGLSILIKDLVARRYQPYVLEIIDMYLKHGIVVVIGAGNDPGPEVIMVENLYGFPISVGGVLHLDSQSGSPLEFVASDTATGYPQHTVARESMPSIQFPPVPHICGLSGSIYVPVPSLDDAKPGEWDLKEGTSLATPQVAAACAYILDAWPSATPEQIREILMRTATKISKGKTYNDHLLSDIQHTLPNGDMASPGLVNIGRAVKVAYALQHRLSRVPHTPDTIAGIVAYFRQGSPELWANAVEVVR